MGEWGVVDNERKSSCGSRTTPSKRVSFGEVSILVVLVDGVGNLWISPINLGILVNCIENVKSIAVGRLVKARDRRGEAN